MPHRQHNLTARQVQDIHHFFNCFAEIERLLKAKLGRRVNDAVGIRALIEEYEKRNAFWREQADTLRNLTDIRNFLTHQRGGDSDYPVIVTSSSLARIRQINDELQRPERVDTIHRKAVVSVAPDQSLASVLSLAFVKGFSQFPVTDGGQFRGFVTENEIIRWIGRHAQTRSSIVDLARVTVKAVLKEKDPHLRGIPIFRFEKLDSGVDDVMSRFSSEPALEAVLLTATGNKTTPVEGIVTQWDAARYAGKRSRV